MENREEMLVQNVEELLREIKENEEEVARWREACELEVEAGRSIVEQRDKMVLLRRFQKTQNHSFDEVLVFLNSKKMTEAGPMDLIDDDNIDTEEGIDKQIRRNVGHDFP